jgi:hypothetical protein
VLLPCWLGPLSGLRRIPKKVPRVALLRCSKMAQMAIVRPTRPHRWCRQMVPIGPTEPPLHGSYTLQMTRNRFSGQSYFSPKLVDHRTNNRPKVVDRYPIFATTCISYEKPPNPPRPPFWSHRPPNPSNRLSEKTPVFRPFDDISPL